MGHPPEEVQALEALDQAHGETYDIWRARDGRWCALRIDGIGPALSGDTPDQLAAAIRADATTRPPLRLAGEGKEDAVVRRRRFEAAHPEVTILRPGASSSRWRAVVPAGAVPGEPTGTTIGAWQLGGLMDQLDVLYPPDVTPGES
jgi:hypothetical protein